MEANESVVEVVKFYDKKINDNLVVIKSIYTKIGETDDDDKLTLLSLKETLDKCESRLEYFLSIRKAAIDQIYY